MKLKIHLSTTRRLLLHYPMLFYLRTLPVAKIM